jgi:hypothetical protein
VKNFLLGWLGAFLLMSPAVAGADIVISAQASPQQVGVGENITLRVTIEGQANINGSPALPDLPDFQVYSGGRSSNFTFINGQVSSSLQFTYILVPKHAGNFTLGPVTLVYDNKTYSTAPMTIMVGSGGAPRQAPAPSGGSTAPGAAPAPVASPGRHGNDPVFITTQVDRHEVYVNEPLVLTFRFYHRIPILAQPQYTAPSTGGFWAEDLPPQREYVATVNGVEFQVTEIKTALFPTTAGKLSIGPATLVVQVEDFNRRSADPFADDFFRNFFSGGRQVGLKSEPIAIKVKPLPAEGRPVEFTGTVGQWALSARLDRQSAKVGEAVTLEVRVFGVGNVKSVGKIELPPVTGFKVYDTISSTDVQKQDYRVRGVKTYRTLLRPEVTGTLTVPPIAYAYFDPKTGRYERMQVPALQLKVAPGEAQAQNFPAPGLSAAPEQSAPGVKVMAKDIRYLKLQVPLTGQTPPRPLEFWLAGFGLPALGLAGIWLWRRRQDKLAADPVYARRRAAGRSARAALHQAHLARNRKDAQGFYSALSLSLMGYLADKLGLSRSGVTQREIVRRLLLAGGEEKKVTQLTELLDECDFARFAPGDREAAAMEQHEALAESLLTEFSRMLAKEAKA